MPITATKLTDAASTTDGTTYTTASISPVAGRVLLVLSQLAGIGTATATTVSGLSGTWTNIGPSFRYNTNYALSAAWCSDYTGTGTLALTNTDSATHGLWCVIEVDGADTTSPIVSGSWSTSSPGSVSAVTITLPSPASSANRVFAGYGCDNNTAAQAAPRASWTELSDRGVGTPTGVLQTQWRSDAHETTASVTWTGGPYTSAGFAFEVAAAGGAASLPPRAWTPRRMGALLDL